MEVKLGDALIVVVSSVAWQYVRLRRFITQRLIIAKKNNYKRKLFSEQAKVALGQNTLSRLLITGRVYAIFGVITRYLWHNYQIELILVGHI